MDYTKLALDQNISRAAASIKERGIIVEVLDDRAAALSRLQELIPAGTGVSMAASVTLTEIGFEDILRSGANSWRNLKGELLAEKDLVKQAELRRLFSVPEYIVGSVQAVCETGEVVIVSQTGSQTAPYAFSAKNVIWVVGAQKIVPTLPDAMKRVREYCAARAEAKGVEKLGRAGMGLIGKVLIFENEVAYIGRSVRMLIVKEVLGY
jgi:L-lactate utilization protein LutB